MTDPPKKNTDPPGERGSRPPRLVRRLSAPFQRFFEVEASSAFLLLAMALVALLWANSPFQDSYHHLWHDTKLSFAFGGFALEMPLGHFVNDALMTIFFFVVGLEIKREMVTGELSSRARAMFPVAGALGGMIVPALIYTGFHLGGPAIRGWGIPMATDIAFAVAALSVLGARVPPGLRIFLLALAIADDIGAVAVIAIFYTDTIILSSLAWVAGGFVLIVFLNRAGVRSFVVYTLVGAFVWYQMQHSGVHPTIAGVILGFLTPAHAEPDDDHDTLVDKGRHAIEHLRELIVGEESEPDPGGHQRYHLMRQLEGVGRQTLSPLDQLVNRLQVGVAYFIMPIFALANAGVTLGAGGLSDPTAQSVGYAVALGLFFGKPIGVTLFAWLAVTTRVAALPAGVSWLAVLATGLLAGIGFTVALFVANLAFPTEPAFTDGAKVGILIGSAAATILGIFVLARVLPPVQR